MMFMCFVPQWKVRKLCPLLLIGFPFLCKGMNEPANFEIVQQRGCEENKLPTYVHDKYTERANDFETFLHPIGKSLFNARSLS